MNANGPSAMFHDAITEYLDLTGYQEGALFGPDNWPAYYRALLLVCNGEDIPIYRYDPAKAMAEQHGNVTLADTPQHQVKQERGSHQ